MKVFCILLCVAFTSGFYIDNNGTHEEKILGGTYVRINSVPYHASVIWIARHNICGATIIHEYWVITAAHCVKNKICLSVRTGSGYRLHYGILNRVERIITHANYTTNGHDNDIALLKLQAPITFDNKQRPIELAKPDDILKEGEMIRISGFGRRGVDLGVSDILKAAYVPVLNQEDCERVYQSSPITDNMFCAGNRNVNACLGDSGGPGVIRSKLYGIIATGSTCKLRILPAVYTKVNKYYHWIEETTGLTF